MDSGEPGSPYLLQRTGNARSQIKSALDNASKIVSLTQTASDYLVGSASPEHRGQPHPPHLSPQRLRPGLRRLSGAGLVPEKVGQAERRLALWTCAHGQDQHCGGCCPCCALLWARHLDQRELPLHDRVDKTAIWWEEGRLTAKVVESAKPILGLGSVSGPEMQASQQTEPTPVTITSNANMCVVTDGNSKTLEHQQPLQDRMPKLELTHRLEPDFGKVTKREVKTFSPGPQPTSIRSQEFLVRKAVSS